MINIRLKVITSMTILKVVHSSKIIFYKWRFEGHKANVCNNKSGKANVNRNNPSNGNKWCSICKSETQNTSNCRHNKDKSNYLNKVEVKNETDDIQNSSFVFMVNQNNSCEKTSNSFLVALWGHI